MRIFFSGFLLVVGFATAITGIASLLNGALGWHISLEGTEAPATVEGALILLALAIWFFSAGFAIKGRPARRLIRYGILVIATLLSAALIRNAVLRDTDQREAHTALLKKDLAYFQKHNLKKMQPDKLAMLFAESIRNRVPAIGALIAAQMSWFQVKRNDEFVAQAAYQGQSEFFKILISHRADFSGRGYLGGGVTHAVVQGIASDADKVKVLQMLAQERLLDVNDRDQFQATPLMTATEKGDIAVMRYLMAHGAKPNAEDNAHRAVMLRACRNSFVYPEVKEAQHAAALRLLLNSPSTVRDKCRADAQSAGYKEVIKLLERDS